LRNSAAKLPQRPPATTPRGCQRNVAFRWRTNSSASTTPRADTEVAVGTNDEHGRVRGIVIAREITVGVADQGQHGTCHVRVRCRDQVDVHLPVRGPHHSIGRPLPGPRRRRCRHRAGWCDRGPAGCITAWGRSPPGGSAPWRLARGRLRPARRSGCPRSSGRDRNLPGDPFPGETASADRCRGDRGHSERGSRRVGGRP
jgi:hypothetical protein